MKGQGPGAKKGKSSRLVIHNYGLFWREDWVDWGVKGRGGSGSLKGTHRRGYGEPTDFRDQFGVYALYADFHLIYVGQTGGEHNTNLFSRLKQHRSGRLASRWNQFSWFGMRRVNKDGALASSANVSVQTTMALAINHLEALAITIAEPRLNRRGGNFGKAKQFYQVVRKGPSPENGE